MINKLIIKLMVALNTTTLAISESSWNSTFDFIRKEIEKPVKSATGKLVIPILLVLTVAYLAFEIYKVRKAKKGRGGEDIEYNVEQIMILLVIIGVLSSFSAWAWNLI